MNDAGELSRRELAQELRRISTRLDHIEALLTLEGPEPEPETEQFEPVLLCHVCGRPAAANTNTRRCSRHQGNTSTEPLGW